MTTADAPDYDDIPDTRDLVPPTPEQMPTAVLANTIAIRAIRRDLSRARTWFRRMAFAFIGGSMTVASSVIGAAYIVGERDARVDQHEQQLRALDERVTHLERKAMGEEP